MNEIGITERGDAALDLGWLPWVKEGNPAILITKDPLKLLFILISHGCKNCNIIVHATITGFGGSFLEPNVPDREPSLTDGYGGLVRLLSTKRVVLRIDPVIPTEKFIKIAKTVLEHRAPGGRVRISFIDQYPHVKARFKEAGVSLPWDTFHAPLKLRQEAYEALGRPDRPEICGEPDFTCTGCISELDCRTLGIPQKKISGKQRKFCACLMNKKELLKNKGQCKHGCLYCYWGKL